MCPTSLDTSRATPVTLSSLFTTEPAPRHRGAASVLRRWASEHLSRSHPELGRKGAVCPFTMPAIKKDLFRVAYLAGGGLSHTEIAGALRDMIDEFLASEVALGDEALETAILVLPDLTEYSLVDAVQLEFKNLFVECDLMVGQFYPGCDESGLWNQHFRPLDAPYAMIAIRRMTKSDYPFLTGDERWASAYLSKFASDIPARVRNDMAKRIAATGRAS